MDELQIVSMPDNTYTAVFIGTDGSGMYCELEEAQNIKGETPEDREFCAMAIWGLDRDNIVIAHN